MKIIAHRGASKFAPENTLAAFQLAYQYGAEYIECDIALSKDNIPFLIHDDTLDRTTNATGLVSQYGWRDLSKLDAGTWFSKEFGDVKLPSLAQVLIWHSQYPLHINFEIKSVHESKVSLTIDSIWKVFESMDDTSCFIFSSFQLSLLTKLRKKANHLNMNYLIIDCSEKAIEDALALNCKQLNISLKTCRPYWIDKIHQAGLGVGVYTVNHAPLFRQLEKWGVDAVFTDDIPLALECLKNPQFPESS